MPDRRNDAVILRYAEGPLHAKMLAVGERRVQRYARQHGYDVRTEQLERFDATFGWHRWRMIRQAFRDGYGFAAYMETDVVIRQLDVDFRCAAAMRPLAMRYGGEPAHYQCGVIFARNVPEVRDFIDALLVHAPSATDPLPEAKGGTWWEWPSCQQEVVRRMLHDASWRDLATRLDAPWNSVAGLDDLDRAMICAWHGTPGEREKLEAMQRYARERSAWNVEDEEPQAMTIGVPTVAVVSGWRNDAGRRLVERAEHLLSKTYPLTRWVWVVDGEDDTGQQLARVAEAHPRFDVEILRLEPPQYAPVFVDAWHAAPWTTDAERREGMGQAINAALDRVRDTDQYVVLHGSELRSPSNVIEQFLWAAGRKPKDVLGTCPIAGWPTMLQRDGQRVFYDTWAYRRDGAHFAPGPPYHAAYRANVPFEVDSVGGVWMFMADDARAGMRCGSDASVDLCRQMRARGRRIWVDPRIAIEQPADLWERPSR